MEKKDKKDGLKVQNSRVERSSSKNKAIKSILSGGISGGIEICITYPTEFIKTHLQLEGKGLTIKHAISDTYSRKGITGFYRGLSPLLYFSIPKAAVRFWAYETMKAQVAPGGRAMLPHENLLCGLFAGVCEAILVVTPQETIKVKMVHDILSPQPKYRGFFHGVSTIVKEQGISGTYKGLVPTIIKQGSNQAIRFATYNPLVENFALMTGTTVQTLNPLYSLLAGALAGAASVFGNTPIDVIKTKMQGLDAAKYKNSWECARTIYRESGPLGFYKGTVPRLGRACPDTAIVMTLYKEVGKILDQFI